jgi:cyclase
MSLKRRIVVCLDVDGGRVVKGVNFRGLRDVGDPVELAARYEAEGADEIVYLDISASAEGRRTLLDVVQKTARQLFIPLTVGGGINGVDDIERALRAGADKVSVNTAAVRAPGLLNEAAMRFGSQCVVLSIDARRPGAEPASAVESGLPAERKAGPRAGRARRYEVCTHGGRVPTGLEAETWARVGAAGGAGEILITSIDRDGRRDGYDIDMTRAIVEAVNVPVIASGGAGNADHMRAAFVRAGADAALAAGIFHDGVTTVGAVKRHLADAGVPIRLPGNQA